MKLPEVIDDCECLVRIIKVPYHWDVKKHRLKMAAFKPKVGSSSISVIRQLIGDGCCKAKAMQMPEYYGLGVLRAGNVRKIECEVEDRPEDYRGHAEINFGFPRPAQDTPDSVEVLERLNELCRDLVNYATMFVDSSSSDPNWNGDALCPKS